MSFDQTPATPTDQFEIDFGVRLLAVAEDAVRRGVPVQSVLVSFLSAALSFAGARIPQLQMARELEELAERMRREHTAVRN